MKLLTLFLYVALLSIGIMPVAVARPNFSDRTNLDQAEASGRLSEIEHPHTTAQWLTQNPEPTSEGESEVVKVTIVRLNSTPTGIEVILETTSRNPLVVSPSSSDNTFVANIKNAQLALPRGNAFRSNNPAEGITSITVTQQSATSSLSILS